MRIYIYLVRIDSKILYIVK